jgi:hypothetical protein
MIPPFPTRSSPPHHSTCRKRPTAAPIKLGHPDPEFVYVYFDNDAKVRAPADARSLRAKLA